MMCMWEGTLCLHLTNDTLGCVFAGSRKMQKVMTKTQMENYKWNAGIIMQKLKK